MKNNEVICGIAALRSISDAYSSLHGDVLQVEDCQEAAAVLMDTICGENPSLLEADAVVLPVEHSIKRKGVMR